MLLKIVIYKGRKGPVNIYHAPVLNRCQMGWGRNLMIIITRGRKLFFRKVSALDVNFFLEEY